LIAIVFPAGWRADRLAAAAVFRPAGGECRLGG
jgi:hypothetical protein